MISDVLVLTLAHLTFKHWLWFSELPPIRIGFIQNKTICQLRPVDCCWCTQAHSPHLWWRTHTPPVKDKHSWLWCGMSKSTWAECTETGIALENQLQAKLELTLRKRNNTALKIRQKKQQINTKLSHTFWSSNVSLYSLHSLKVVTVSEVCLPVVYILCVQSGVEFVWTK